VQASFAAREPVPQERRRLRLVAVAIGAAAVVAGALATSPGQAVLDEIREVVGVERSQPALFSLPSGGRLLVASDAGLWVVHGDGSRRLLGVYREGSWSPFGRFVVAARANELAALEPDGDVRWTIARPGVRSPRWAGSAADTRIAYLDRTGLRVVAGDGTGDRLFEPAGTGPFAWRPGAMHELAYFVPGELRLGDVDVDRVRWGRIDRWPPVRVIALSWSTDGRRLAVVLPWQISLLDAHGRLLRRFGYASGEVDGAALSPDGTRLAVLRQKDVLLIDLTRRAGNPRRVFASTGTLEGLHWSPDGRWLLVGWPAADQWIFVRADGKRIRAVSNVSEQFRSRGFPRVESWCCSTP
jgi:hypothetical protein